MVISKLAGLVDKKLSSPSRGSLAVRSSLGSAHARATLDLLQRWDLIFADLVKHDPGCAKQNS